MIDGVTHRNLASPDYEPSDADLVELMHEAFAGVREANEESLRQLRERIASPRVARRCSPRLSAG